MKVAVLLANGFETIEALTVVDVLRRAEVKCDTFGVDVKEVESAQNIVVKADYIFGDSVYDYDIVVLPGGMPGASNLRDNKGVNDLVKDFYEKNKIVAGICAGPITFGKLNLCENKNVTCYPGFEKELGNCNYTGNMIEVDKNMITGKGPAASADFAFTILEKIKEEKVEILKKGMLFK